MLLKLMNTVSKHINIRSTLMNSHTNERQKISRRFNDLAA